MTQLLVPALSFAQGQLKDDAFSIVYGARGITSLKRVGDAYDTEYISSGGVLGNIAIQYKTASDSDWTAAREVAAAGDQSTGNNTIRYSIGSLAPTLPQQSKAFGPPSAISLSALSDDQFPQNTAPPGRGARGAGAGRGSAFFNIPTACTWQNERGQTDWVQYTFPKEEEVSNAQVYWQTDDAAEAKVKVPASWRLLYSAGDDWKEVEASTPYGVAADQFNRVEFKPVKTTALRLEVKMADEATAGVYEWRVGPERIAAPLKNLAADESFALDGGVLSWTLKLANQSDQPLEIGDLALPLAMAEGTPPGRGQIYTQKLIRHSFIAGNGSWVYWQRANAEGPFLVMVPQGQTKIEYSGAFTPVGAAGAAGLGRGFGGGFGRSGFTPFIHAAVSSVGPIVDGKAAGREQPWRLPISNLKLAAKGTPGDWVTYSFHFAWAKDFDDVRDVLFKEGSIDVNIVPGMAIPTDLPALISLRTKHKINEIAPEFPDKTKVEFVVDRGDGIKVYKVHFAKLGENMLTVKYADNRWSTLQFFVTEPLETVISKRSSFLVNSMQHKDPNQWWYGVYSDWDEVHKKLRSPIDRDGLSPWLTDASDDAGNARPAYVASKNAFLPDQKEIDSVELYIKQYLFNGHRWDEGRGGMQMTEKEPYPYGIYGTFDNWYQHRTIDPKPPANFVPQTQTLPQDIGWTRLHREHLWRIYDYPHIMLLYFRMYQIAKAYPAMVHFANADEYLMLAYHTSVAYWTVPMQTDKPRGWSANVVPTMNEAFVPELITALEREGKKPEAAKLHELWNGKVTRFVNVRTRPNLFGSEFAFDSTGFESTGSMAHYAMDHATKAGEQGPYTADEAKEFLEFQLRLDMGDRGWLENTYYQLGSDYRGGLSYLLSYMSQMGGWSILDYGLYFAKDPAKYLRLGYASSLSSWALVNSGTEESGYGFWWPGKENDGATGGGFNPEPMGSGWIRKAVPRGAWYYSAEEDVGYCGALRTHATIVTKDPIFGEFAYGGELARKGDSVEVIPRDGLRARFHVVRDDQRLHLELRGDGFAKEKPIVVSDALSKIRFTLENRAGTVHQGQVELSGLPAGNYRLFVDGAANELKVADSKTSQVVDFPISPAATAQIAIERVQ